MRLRDQLIAAAALAVVTGFGILRIAEAKCDEAVGARGIRLDAKRPEELAAFRKLLGELGILGQAELAGRLEELRKDGHIWVAPGLGPDRWAAYVDALGLVRRIYIRQLALLDPLAHLYPRGAPDIPPAYQRAFATLSLCGAMRHELAHYDGALSEESAYTIELAWYQEIRASAFFVSRQGEELAAWDWALRSAGLSAREAARKAAAAGEPVR